jgi:hypothetical protein
VGPGTGLLDVERRKILSLPGLELRSLGRPICKIFREVKLTSTLWGRTILPAHPLDSLFEALCNISITCFLSFYLSFTSSL